MTAPMAHDRIGAAIFDLLARQPVGKSISPEDVARAVEPEGWRRQLSHVRGTAIGLAREGRLVITRHGKPADPDEFKGVWRMKLPDASSL
ncbi:DUF3253 domain-containing protein [Phenylobacterium sp.]|uniref:DUF3253 domain-containing protein n=1 Tax=Phenylobacterium sp. TaxID=1871053 RepID=UPI002DE763C4|nr:DUF3253 domain-containing protein [Phenylobacterium sp.]